MVKPNIPFKFNDRNGKLGDGIFAFSIDRQRSCLGASAVCQEICYGACNRSAWTPFVMRYLDNFTLSRSALFAENMLGSLANERPVAFRVHDVGDFYSANYARKWLKIIRARRDIFFFGYTRAWVSAELVPELRRLAVEPNMTLFLSLDRSMPYDRIPGTLADLPRAWLATTDEDIPQTSLRVAVVFRNLRNKILPLKNPGHFGATVCLAETGQAKVTCRQCEYCWRRWKTTRAHVGTAACRRAGVDATAISTNDIVSEARYV